MSRLSTLAVHIKHDSVTIDGHVYRIPGHSFTRELQPRGTNGIVFEAYDESLQRKDAIKIWIPTKHDPRDRRQQALAEVRKVASLNHRNIVQIYTCDELPRGLVYAVMEYIDGLTLRDYLTSQNPHFGKRMSIWREIEDAIKYAHEHQVYHGDLHDKNVLISDPNIKVIDFGTSLFASRKVNSRLRETRKLVSLCQEIFSTFEPRLLDIVEPGIYQLTPELVLSALSSWASILWEWNDITRMDMSYKKEDLYRKLWLLTERVTSTPVFSCSSIAAKLEQIGLPSKVDIPNGTVDPIDLFYGLCVAWARLRLAELDETKADPQRKNLARMTKYNFNIQFGIDSNKSFLETLWPQIQDGFHQFGQYR